MKYNKYGNKKTQIDGYTFDSKAEAARYKELKLLQASGDIKELELQPEFTLIPAQKINSKLQGKITERAVKYKADFAYKQLVPFTEPKEWVDVVEDVKGMKTKEYIIKRKLFRQLYTEIEFREVER